MVRVIYVWNEAKRTTNVLKHGVDFNAIKDIDWTRASVVRDGRHDYGERRLVAYAPILGRLHAVVFTRNGPIRRIISMRKANRRERAIYDTTRR